jgi:UDP-N-acetylbacillosamine N-acetyltransferase
MARIAMPIDSIRRALYVFGAGGHGKVVADMAIEAGWEVRGFLDDSAAALEEIVLGLPTVGGRDWLREQSSPDDAVVVAIGNNALRMRVQQELEELRIAIATIVSTHAVVSKWATIGRGVVVMPGAVINAGAVIGNGAIINSGAVIEHDCVIGEFAHVSPNCSLGGGVTVGDLSQVGLGSAILPFVRVGARTTLGAGSVANRHLPDDVVAFGVPARIRRAPGNRHSDSLLVLNKS